MKRIILIMVLVFGLTVTYGFAQMGMGGHMESGQGMMGQRYDDDRYEYSQNMGPGMMGPGHMGGMMGDYGMPPCMMGRGHMGGMMGGYGYRGDDPEAYKKCQEDYQKFLDDTVGLRRKLHNKKFEYKEALRNSDTTRKSLLKLEKEMMDLQWKIYEKAPGE